MRADAATGSEILAEAARHIARYKLPKDILFCPKVMRSPSGKPDYRWAKSQVAEGVWRLPQRVGVADESRPVPGRRMV